MACLSSFFRFLMRMEMVTSNPCDRLERPRTSASPPRGLSADEVRRLLLVIPDTPVGLRNRALILTLVLTGRRRAEVFRLTRGDLSFDGNTCFYSYRGKGGKSGRSELPRPALDALRAALTAFGRELEAMVPGGFSLALTGPHGWPWAFFRHVLRATASASAPGRHGAGRSARLPAYGRQAQA